MSQNHTNEQIEALSKFKSMLTESELNKINFSLNEMKQILEASSGLVPDEMTKTLNIMELTFLERLMDSLEKKKVNLHFIN